MIMQFFGLLLFIGIAVIAVGIGFFPSQESYAGECNLLSLERNYELADVVFSGTVIKIVEGPYSFTTITFEVSETWKGETEDIMVVESFSDVINCGIGFGVGEFYLVYANEDKDKFFTNANDGTQTFSSIMGLYGGYERWSDFPEIIAEKEKCLVKNLDLAAENVNLSAENQKFMSPKMQIFCEVPLDMLQCNIGLQLIFKSTDNSPACVKSSTVQKLVERGWGIASDITTPLKTLQSCSRIPGEEITCSAGFVCYEELSGGLGPPGTNIPIESIGGDQLCHKECETDNDCPLNAPICLRTVRMTEDYVESFKLCFSE